MKIKIKNAAAINALRLDASVKVDDIVEVTQADFDAARLREGEYELVNDDVWTKPTFVDVSGNDDRPYGQRGLPIDATIAIGEQDKDAAYNGTHYNAFKRTDRAGARPISARTLIEGAVLHPTEVAEGCIKVTGDSRTAQVNSFLAQMTTGKIKVVKRFSEPANADGRPQFSYIWANV